MRNSILILSILLSIVHFSLGQHIRSIPGHSNAYLIGNDLYVYHDMKSLFSQDEEAHEYYQKSIKDQQAARTTGIITLGTTAAFAALMITSHRTDNYLDKTGTAFMGLGVMTLIPIVGTVSLIKLGSANANKRKAIQRMNLLYSTDQDLGHIEKLDLQHSTRNSIGLSMEVTGSAIGFKATF